MDDVRRVWVRGGTRGLGAAVAAAFATQRAQVWATGASAEHEPEVFDEVVDVNLGGTMRVCASARRRAAA